MQLAQTKTLTNPRNKRKTISTFACAILLISCLIGITQMGKLPFAHTKTDTLAVNPEGAAYIYENGNYRYVNSTTAGYKMVWDKRYSASISASIAGESLQSLNQSGYEIKSSTWKSVNYIESYNVSNSGMSLSSNNGNEAATQTIIRNSSDWSEIQISRSPALFPYTIRYTFYADEPYIYVRITRNITQSVITQNSQTCQMIVPEFRLITYTNYTGQIATFDASQNYRTKFPMFAAMENNMATTFPFFGAYNPDTNLTVGRIYINASMNVINDINMWLAEWGNSTAKYLETQEDWQQNEMPSNYWRNGTTMSLDFLLFIKSGTPTSTGNIYDTAKNLFDNNLIQTPISYPGEYQAVYGNWSGWGSNIRGYTGFLQYQSGYGKYTGYAYQNSLVSIPYLETQRLTLYSQTSYKIDQNPFYTRCYFDNYWADNSYNTTTLNYIDNGSTSMIGSASWATNNYTIYSNIAVHNGSDKLILYGNVTFTTNTPATYCQQELRFKGILYGDQVIEAVAPISPTEYDLRWQDPIHGWVGVYVKVNNGTVSYNYTQLNIEMFNSPATYAAGSSYQYNYTLWGHIGNATSMSSFYSILQLALKTFSIDNRGIEPTPTMSATPTAWSTPTTTPTPTTEPTPTIPQTHTASPTSTSSPKQTTSPKVTSEPPVTPESTQYNTSPNPTTPEPTAQNQPQVQNLTELLALTTTAVAVGIAVTTLISIFYKRHPQKTRKVTK
jgi:hypothetical protein